ncbi:MAG: response regulator [Bacteroidota bacterium]
MFKLLIADDEAGSREWLAQEIPWEQHEICLVGPAVDGSEAWRMVQDERPEIILTDIRMPGMDGIELARSALNLNPHTRVLVISGYDEFAYAKKCLELGVTGYILKPTPPEEILQAVLKERDLLLNKRNDEATRKLFQSQLENSIPILREHFLRDLLYGEIEEKDLPERLCFLKLPFQPEQPCIALILEIEDNTGFYLNYDERERQLIWFLMNRIAQTDIGDRGFTARLERGGVGAVLFGSVDCANKELIESANRMGRSILDQARLHLSCALVIGIGGIAPNLTQVRDSFEQAKQALKYHSQFGVETIVAHSNCFSGEKPLPVFLPIDEEKLKASLERGNSAGLIKATLENLLGSALSKHDPSQTSDQQRETGWMLTGTLVRLSQRAGLTVRDVMEAEDYALLMQGGPSGSAEAVTRWWETQFGRLGHAIQKLYNNSQRTCILQVKEYIEQNLAESITLSKAANWVYMSPSYLSRLFREQTGESFSEYVTRRKMEVARRLLEEGNQKVYEVAMAVGYTDPAYFGRVFRQYFNVTPTDLRK